MCGQGRCGLESWGWTSCVQGICVHVDKGGVDPRVGDGRVAYKVCVNMDAFEKRLSLKLYLHIEQEVSLTQFKI